MKKTGLYGYIYDISVDHERISIDDINDIYKHLMEKFHIL